MDLLKVSVKGIMARRNDTEKSVMGDVIRRGTSYNAPRLHVAIEARKIVVSGEAAGLQIQLGPPAVPGRFDSCDLPPKFFRHHPRESKNPLFSKHIVNHSSVTVRQDLPESMKNMYSDVYRFFIHIFGLYTWHLQIYKSNEQSPKTSHTH